MPPAVYLARPALRVDEDADPALDARIVALSIDETAAGLARCELTLTNWGTTAAGQQGYLDADLRRLALGARLQVTAGGGERSGVIFDGSISAVEGQYPASAAPRLCVLAEDRLGRLRTARRSRSFADASDDEAITAVAREHGLRTRAVARGPTHRVIAQVNTSDLAFVRERARRLDADLRLDGDELHVTPRAERTPAGVTLTIGADLREATLTADLAGQRTAVTVSGWDERAKRAASARADAAAVAVEAAGGVSGPVALEQASGARPEHLAHLLPASDTAARALAEQHLRATARRFVTGLAVAEGDARLRPWARLRLAGVAPMHEGEYDIVAARHTFDEITGFATAVEVERAWLGGAA